MISNVLLILILSALYILSVVAIHFVGISAYKLREEPHEPAEDEDDGLNSP